VDRTCFRCGVSIRRHSGIARVCLACNGKPSLLAARAHGLVHRAVKKGELPPARALACADCGKPACDYDHRDYNKPLEVEPTCRRCNLLRGSAVGSGAVRVLRLAAEPATAGEG
jgi:hypothetical protein